MEVVVEPFRLFVSYMAGQPQRVSIVACFHLHHLLCAIFSLPPLPSSVIQQNSSSEGREEVGEKKDEKDKDRANELLVGTVSALQVTSSSSGRKIGKKICGSSALAGDVESETFHLVRSYGTDWKALLNSTDYFKTKDILYSKEMIEHLFLLSIIFSSYVYIIVFLSIIYYEPNPEVRREPKKRLEPSLIRFN